MKVKELIFELRNIDPDKEIVVQKQSGPEYFSLHKFVLQRRGHIGYDGPIVHLGYDISEDSNKTPNEETDERLVET